MKSHEHTSSVERVSRAAVRVACPRCAYDLTGTTAKWTSACEIDGTCPECGLAFSWRDILDPLRIMPRWFYESPFRSALGAFVPTVPRMLMPASFWRSISMAFPIRIRRLVAIPLASLLLLHFMIAMATATKFSSECSSLKATFGAAIALPGQMETYPHILLWPYTGRSFQALWTPAPVVGRPTRPAQLVHIPTHAAFRPGLVTILLAPALMPLTYLLLRQTMRKTKVRRLHLFRIFAYSSVLIVPLGMLHISAWAVWENLSGVPSTIPLLVAFMLNRVHAYTPGLPALAAIELIALALWWRSATRYYLRLPHAGGIVFMMLTITVLAVLVSLMFTHGGQLFY